MYACVWGADENDHNRLKHTKWLPTYVQGDDLHKPSSEVQYQYDVIYHLQPLTVPEMMINISCIYLIYDLFKRLYGWTCVGSTR